MTDRDARKRHDTAAPTKKPGDSAISAAIAAGDLSAYQRVIMHDWLRTLTLLVVILVPIFFLLDLVTMPAALLPRFAIYRLVSVLIAILQLIIIRRSAPGRRSFLHGYLTSLQVSTIIALMTVDLGGFDSSYYAGLNLVIIGVNLLMPWRAQHTAFNALITITLYVLFNLFAETNPSPTQLINNLFFMIGTSVIAVCINYLRYNQITKEFSLLVKLNQAREALWTEIALAKRIQTALLPQNKSLAGYDIAVTMIPAEDVGGDYYDIIETGNQDRWITIGDVAGHGIDSGLIMMMAQASIMTVIKGTPAIHPRDVLATVNGVIKEDITRLGSNHYMTLMLLKLENDSITFAGHHQDILLYRSAEKQVSNIPNSGTWLGIVDNIKDFIEVQTLNIAIGDIVLLFTDGITECTNAAGEMYGQERLRIALQRWADQPLEEILRRILEEINQFQVEQEDDITLILLRKTANQALSSEKGEKP